MTLDKWDYRFLALAKFISAWSKDPSTKVGAVITDVNNRIVSLGYNGLPARVPDKPDRLEDRERKLVMVVHGEMNAILFAERSLHGCTLYTYPFAPCSNCAAVIIQAGLRRVVAPRIAADHKWANSINLTALMFNEAGVQLDLT